MALASPLNPAAGTRLARLKAQARKPGEASFFFYDAHFKNDAVKILPGEYFVDDEDILIMTTLGSCIAACLWDRNAHVGGMNHFMLPDGAGNGLDSGRYGSYAMELLINELMKRGATRSTLEAKVFGGGAVMESLASSNVGVRNAEFVLKFLNTEKVPVVAKDLLDSYPRKVYYFPSTGKVLVKKLHRVHNDTLFSREREYKERLVTAKVEGDVELFI